MKGSKKSNFTDVMLRWEFKFTVTIFLLMLAFTEYTKNPDRVHELCLWGMAFSTLGDLFLMDYMGVPQHVFKGKQFYAGMASFVIAHVLYRQMFRAAAPEYKFFDVGDIVTLAIMITLFMAVYNMEFKKKSKLFFGASGFYTGIILANLAAAVNCVAANDGRYVWAMIGVVSFMISDALLFVREAKKDTPAIRKLVWVFYPLAQILIIMGI